MKLKLKEIFQDLEISDDENARKAFYAAFDYLLYLGVGSSLKTPQAQFKRSSARTFTVDQSPERHISIPDVMELVDEK